MRWLIRKDQNKNGGERHGFGGAIVFSFAMEWVGFRKLRGGGHGDFSMSAGQGKQRRGTDVPYKNIEEGASGKAGRAVINKKKT